MKDPLFYLTLGAAVIGILLVGHFIYKLQN